MQKIKLIILILCIVGVLFFLNTPVNFPQGVIVRIEPGESLRNVSLKLKQRNIIRSRLVFEAFAIVLGGEKHIKYSDYLFENKLPVYEVAWRIVNGENHMAPVVVTIPEGYNALQIADTFSSKLVNFDKDQFLKEAKEGYLFPDTYFFSNEDDEAKVLVSINKNFERKILPLRPLIVSSGKTEKEIIIMASLVEAEAKGENDRSIIAGILWKRLSIGMPLQVDVALETYKVKGLPKDPVGNPGVLAIKAAITPTQSPYLYYLHDEDGNIHYAKTFEEHKLNKLKYLK